MNKNCILIIVCVGALAFAIWRLLPARSPRLPPAQITAVTGITSKLAWQIGHDFPQGGAILVLRYGNRSIIWDADTANAELTALRTVLPRPAYQIRDWRQETGHMDDALAAHQAFNAIRAWLPAHPGIVALVCFQILGPEAFDEITTGGLPPLYLAGVEDERAWNDLIREGKVRAILVTELPGANPAPVEKPALELVTKETLIRGQ